MEKLKSKYDSLAQCKAVKCKPNRGEKTKRNVWANIFQGFLLGSISFKTEYSF